MSKMEKRVLTIQDFSCLGRCSLTVAIPTLSAAGLETVAIPTAVLSNHTAFPSWTFHDLTDEMMKTVEKWKGYCDSFDYIYTGYLSTKQIPIVIDIIKRFKKENTIVIVDPAMADNGKLYPGFSSEHVEWMRKLIQISDIAIPNLTEACLLASLPFPKETKGIPYCFCEKLLSDISSLGPRKVIVSGLENENGEIEDRYIDEDVSGSYKTPCHPGRFHGTGDLFASAFVGALSNDLSFETAIQTAHDYVHEAIGITNANGKNGLLYGPDFESAIPSYINMIRNSKNR